MVLLAKLALGFTGTLAMATVYTLRDGVVNVEVEQHGVDGTNVHVWAPAAVVPMVLHFVPDGKLGEANEKMAEFGPTIRALTKELKKLFHDFACHRLELQTARSWRFFALERRACTAASWCLRR